MTITFTTDFEPHRIKTMRKNPPKTIEAGQFLASAKVAEEANAEIHRFLAPLFLFVFRRTQQTTRIGSRFPGWSMRYPPSSGASSVQKTFNWLTALPVD
ncbi:MAG TPA: hypothetical protein VN699_12795 [Pirellulales bacterium]|nr:hypothetical protein [Pirellulales bacterium]